MTGMGIPPILIKLHEEEALSTYMKYRTGIQAEM